MSPQHVRDRFVLGDRLLANHRLISHDSRDTRGADCRVARIRIARRLRMKRSRPVGTFRGGPEQIRTLTE
jgi:hypothetical protein